jgi:NDP-sugar pyrophosphorylase family protein
MSSGSGRLNIVVPMAGRGQRFRDAGFDVPKPLIPVHGVPMIRLVIENIRPTCEHRFVFLVLQEHLDRYGIGESLLAWAPGAAIVPIGSVTEGAACTVLCVEELIGGVDPLMIANSDQWVDCRIDRYLAAMEEGARDGLIMTMTADDPKWSYVGLRPDGSVDRVVEKQVISPEATVGVYNFRHGRLFTLAARRMISKDLRVNGEFYVAPVFNEIIADGARVGTFGVGRVDNGMYGLGTPGDLERFLGLEVSSRAARATGASRAS